MFGIELMAILQSIPSFPIAQLIPDRCNLESLENAESIVTLFSGRPLQLVNDTADGRVARRLGYFFEQDAHLRRALEQVFATGMLRNLAIEVVSQQDLYRNRAEAQNRFDSTTQQAIVRLADRYVIGDYDSPCAISLAGIDNEFSEVILRAQYYATYGIALQPSVFQESATLAVSSLVSLVLQGEQFQSAEEVRVFLQETLARSQRSYARTVHLPHSSPEQDSAFIAAWLTERLRNILPMPFPDGRVEFAIDPSAGRGNVIKPVVVAE